MESVGGGGGRLDRIVCLRCRDQGGVGDGLLVSGSGRWCALNSYPPHSPFYQHSCSAALNLVYTNPISLGVNVG